MFRYVSLFCCLFASLFAETPEAPGIADLVGHGSVFLESLNPDQKQKALQAFNSADRNDWHYVPRKRAGLAWSSMTEKQQELSWAFFKAALSQSGAAKAEGVVAAERLLWERSNHSDFRDPQKYFVLFFGLPQASRTWGARLEGHHLSINLTVVDGKHIYVTPSFLGTNPDQDPSGNRPLAAEFDLAQALVHTLSDKQHAEAFVAGRTPKDIITGARPAVDAPAIKGLSVADMSPSQAELLMQLIREYVGRYRDAFAADDLEKIRAAGLNHVHFYYSGKMERGKAVYYRVQGPTFILEYSNVQNGANHAHTVWRDFDNDFGYDALREHHRSHH